MKDYKKHSVNIRMPKIFLYHQSTSSKNCNAHFNFYNKKIFCVYTFYNLFSVDIKNKRMHKNLRKCPISTKLWQNLAKTTFRRLYHYHERVNCAHLAIRAANLRSFFNISLYNRFLRFGYTRHYCLVLGIPFSRFALLSFEKIVIGLIRENRRRSCNNG